MPRPGRDGCNRGHRDQFPVSDREREEASVPFPKDKPEAGPDKHEQARQLAEAALREQQAGNDAAAEHLFDQAVRTDPEAVANVLAERDAALREDLIEAPVDDAEVERIVETVEPKSDPPSRAGISGSGSGADSEKR